MYLAVTCKKLFHGPQIEKTWSKQLKPGGALTVNREENLTKYAGSIYAWVKKAEKMGRVRMRKLVTSSKARFIIDIRSKTYFSSCVFDYSVYLQKARNMQDRHLCWPPTFSLAPQ